MKLWVLTSEVEINFVGTLNACIAELKKKNIDAEGIWIRKGVVLTEIDILDQNDIVYILPKTRRTDSSTYIDYMPQLDVPPQPIPPVQPNNRRYLSFGLRLLLLLAIFMQSSKDIAFYFIYGFIFFVLYTNTNLMVHIRQPTTRLSSFYNITISFFGTLIPGLMEVDPGRLLMEMHNAQQAADQVAQGLLE